MMSRKGKQTKKISLLAVIVALICMTLAVTVMANEPSRVKGDACYTKGDLNGDGEVSKSDAIYLLYHTVNPEAYPLAQNGNFDKDEAGKVSGSDALAIIDALLTGEPEVVHAYGEPDWVWVEENGTVTATAEYTCACGKEPYNATVNLTEKGRTAATCSANGSITYLATTDLGDQAEYTVVLQATGHKYPADAKACQEQTCLNGCGYTKKAEAHTLSIELEDKTVAGKACTFVEMNKCAACGAEVEGEEYVKHTFTSKLTKEATCTQKGEKTYTCSVCQDPSCAYTEEVDIVADAHTWEVSANDETLYTCKETGCTETKTVVKATVTGNSATAAVDNSIITSDDVEEVEFDGAAIKLDSSTKETLGDLAGNTGVEIQIEKTDVSALNGLTEEQKGQIGTNPVYDFSMTAGGQSVSDLGGDITITVKYELQPGDDVDCIDIWFVNDNGEVEVVKGTYNNGYVTFTTNHFSYYTVTRLTPAQRCEAYKEHVDTILTAEATCENDGYIYKACTRCGRTEKTITDEATGHNYVEVSSSKVTCTEAGYVESKCTNCNHEKADVIEAPGHDYEAEKTVEATCETRGYKSKKCKNCDYEERKYLTAAAGHDYKAEWTWDKENLTATLVLTCQREECESAPVTLDGVVGIQKQVGATCADKGYILYTAAITHNGTTYNDTYKVEEAQLAHKLTNEWKYNELNHYKECSMCGGKVNEAAHKLSEATVVTEATCTTPGSKVATCECGYLHTTEIQALGHDMNGEDCKRCDFTTNTCNHDDTTYVEIDLSDSIPCGGFVGYTSCECGKNASLDGYDLRCDFEYKTERGKDANGLRTFKVTGVCNECGMKHEETTSWEVTSDCMGTCYIALKLTDKDGNVLVDFKGIERENVQHPTVVMGATDDLSALGMCGGTATHTSCICGEYQSVDFDYDCELVYQENEEGLEIYLCDKCGVKEVDTYGDEKIDDCHYVWKSNHTFYKNDVKLASYDMEYFEEMHDCDSDMVLDGDECTDGYTVTYTCKNCDYSDVYHRVPDSCAEAAMYTTIDLSKYNICTTSIEGWICPCGNYVEYNKYELNTNHDWIELDWKETQEGDVRVVCSSRECQTCGLIWDTTNTYKYTTDSCDVEYIEDNKLILNDEIILKENFTRMTESHDIEVISYELNGDSCEDGGVVITACKDCGKVFEEHLDGWHSIYLVGSYNLADYGMCGGTVEMYSCVCGEEQHINETTKDGEKICKWVPWLYDDETETTTYKCETCGMYRQNSYESELIEGCLYKHTEKYEYLSDYEVFLTAKVSREWYMHDHEYTFELLGDSCSDGYYTNATCKKCNVTERWYNQPQEGEHPTYSTETYNLADYGFCGGEVGFYECPCGERKNCFTNIHNACQWMNIGWDPETRTDYYECTICGGTYECSRTEMGKENCMQTEQIVYKFFDKNGEEVVSLECTNTYPSHNVICTMVLDPGATTCEGGYTVTERCQDCDYVDTYHDVSHDGYHHDYPIEKINMGEKGFCDGNLVVRQCACGLRKHVTLDSECNMTRVSEGPDKYVNVCETCQGTEEVTFGVTTFDGCIANRDETNTYYNANVEVVYTYVSAETWYNHDFEVLGYTLNGTSCTEGYTETLQCKDCGATTTNQGMEHIYRIEEKVDLSSYNICPGMEITKRSCYCAQNQSMAVNYMNATCRFTYDTTSYVDDLGVTHELETRECLDCGLTFTYDKVKHSMGNCTAQVNYNTIVSINGKIITSANYVQQESDHDMETTYEFMPGSNNCEDGVYETISCKNCSYSWTNEIYGHVATEVNGADSRIDLSQYGATCGTYLVHKACICGEYDNYEFEGKCDLGYASITPWIGQQYEGQETTNGWRCPAYCAYDVKCAVTDPECNLYMRKCEYSVYDEATCTMTEYTVWQLGYDAESGTCQKEISYVSASYAYHNYVEDTSTTDTEDGGRINKYEAICSTCGSSHVNTYIYDADGHMAIEETVKTNTLNNGEPISKTSRWTYVVHNNFQYDGEVYYETVYADSSVTWSKTARTYDWENFDCTCQVTYTNDTDTVGRTETETCHRGIYAPVGEDTRSCSQPCYYYYSCNYCGETDMDDYNFYQPYGHSYVDGQCTRCGLESLNGADGAIILEDLTAKHGNNTNYVIGFFNRGGINFVNNVSIVTADGEIVTLTGINFTILKYSTDGVTAVSVDIAEVQAAATAAGVDGDVRIAFVPTDSGTDLDYAITLTE